MGELTQIYSSTASRRHRTWRGRRRRSAAMAARGLLLAAAGAVTALGVALERIVA
jgi:hypothetical protein